MRALEGAGLLDLAAADALRAALATPVVLNDTELTNAPPVEPDGERVDDAA